MGDGSVDKKELHIDWSDGGDLNFVVLILE